MYSRKQNTVVIVAWSSSVFTMSGLINKSVVGGVRRGNRAKKAKQDFTFDENYHKRDGGSGRSHCQKTKGFTVTSSEEQRPQPSRDKTKATSSKKTVEAGKAIKVPCLKPGEVRRKERCSIPTLSNKGRLPTSNTKGNLIENDGSRQEREQNTFLTEAHNKAGSFSNSNSNKGTANTPKTPMQQSSFSNSNSNKGTANTPKTPMQQSSFSNSNCRSGTANTPPMHQGSFSKENDHNGNGSGYSQYHNSSSANKRPLAIMPAEEEDYSDSRFHFDPPLAYFEDEEVPDLDPTRSFRVRSPPKSRRMSSTPDKSRPASARSLFRGSINSDVVVDYLAGLAQQNEQLFSVVTSLAAQNKLNGKENYEIPRTPFDDDEIFLAHEKKLLEKDYRNFYISYLSTIGGNDVTSSAKLILKATIDKEVALEYSLQGKGKLQKKAFNSTVFYSAFTSALRDRFGKSYDEQIAKDCVMNFLKNASDRKGGREERRKRSGTDTMVGANGARDDKDDSEQGEHEEVWEEDDDH